MISIPPSFQTAYERLNQPEYHPFTTDNQDFLVYICLILGGGLIEPGFELVDGGELRESWLPSTSS